jgi:hypothetical protein
MYLVSPKLIDGLFWRNFNFRHGIIFSHNSNFLTIILKDEPFTKKLEIKQKSSNLNTLG